MSQYYFLAYVIELLSDSTSIMNNIMRSEEAEAE